MKKRELRVRTLWAQLWVGLVWRHLAPHCGSARSVAPPGWWCHLESGSFWFGGNAPRVEVDHLFHQAIKSSSGGAWPSGKAADFGSAIVGSNPAAPATYIPTSHRVESNTAVSNSGEAAW